MTTIVRPLLLAPGAMRSREPMQVACAARSATTGGTAWSLSTAVKAVTPGATWTLSAGKAAQLWGTTDTALDLAAHAYMTFAKEGIDQLYAVKQEDWGALSATETICPIAWVDGHHDLTPRLKHAALVALFSMQTGTTSDYWYGTQAMPSQPYPPPGTGPDIVSGVWPHISSNRIAAWNGSVMLAMYSGLLSYMADPADSTTGVVVSLPHFTATDVTPRVLGINSDPAGAWWALVEYDPGASTWRGLVVLTSTTQAAVHDTDWTLAYTILDMTIDPAPGGATAGLQAADATTIDRATDGFGYNVTTISGESMYLPGDYDHYLNNFRAAYDTDKVFAGVAVVHPIHGWYPSGAAWSFGVQYVNFAFTAGSFLLYADPSTGLHILAGSDAPIGCAAILRLTVTARDTTYTAIKGATFAAPVTVASPQTLPSAGTMTFEAYGARPTGSGIRLVDPTNIGGLATYYAGSAIGLHTESISVTHPYAISSPMCWMELDVGGSIAHANTGSSYSTLSVRVHTHTQSGNSVDLHGAVEHCTVTTLPAPSNYTGGVGGLFWSGPSIIGECVIGDGTTPPPAPTVQALGIGPQGETIINTGYGYLYKTPATLNGIAGMPSVPGNRYIGHFGAGAPSPVAVQHALIDGTGSVDTTALVAMAAYDGSTFYAVCIDGSLRARSGPFGVGWVVIAPAFLPPWVWVMMALRVLPGGIVEAVYGSGGNVYSATCSLATGVVNTSIGVPFPTFESVADQFGIAAFLR